MGAGAVTDLDSRLEGAVWGHLVGDALGVPYEFQSPPAVVEWGHDGTWRQPPGTWSDDGALMLALLHSLVDDAPNLDDQARRALDWYRHSAYAPGPRFDVGRATAAALERYERGVPAKQAGGANEGDNGNGSLMRILPVGLLFFQATDAQLVELASEASSVTHGHPRSRACCAVYTLMVRDAVLGNRPNIHGALARARLAFPDELRAELATIQGWRERSGSGYVVDTLWSAWEAFDHSSSYEEAVVRAVRYGNDTDTTAAVAGGLAGAWYGIESVPPPWLEEMRGREIVEPLLEELKGLASIGR